MNLKKGMAFSELSEAFKELYYWQEGFREGRHGGPPTNFHAKLYNLIAKADPQNLARIEQGFPREVMAWKIWQQTPLDALPALYRNAGVFKREDPHQAELREAIEKGEKENGAKG